MFNVLTNQRMFLKWDKKKPYIRQKILYLGGRKKRQTGRLIPPSQISTGINLLPKLFGSARRRGKKKKLNTKIYNSCRYRNRNRTIKLIEPS